MAEPTGLDALTAGFREQFGPPVEERIALNVAPKDMSVRQLFQSVEILRAEVEQRVPIGDVDRFLRRERDEYEPRGECWNTVDDVLDAFRLHVVTSTPLTEPRPHEGPEALFVGKEPKTEAEELRRQVERLTEERDQAIAHDRQPYPTQWAYDQACAALEKHRQRADKAEAELAAIRARAHARSEELLTARDRRPSDDRERRRRFEFAAHEVRTVVRPSTTQEEER